MNNNGRMFAFLIIAGGVVCGCPRRVSKVCDFHHPAKGKKKTYCKKTAKKLRTERRELLDDNERRLLFSSWTESQLMIGVHAHAFVTKLGFKGGGGDDRHVN